MQYSSSAKIHSVRALINELCSGRDLIRQLVLKDIKVRYGQSRFSLVWSLFPQLAAVLIYTALSKYKVVNVGSYDLPELLHIVWSISLWQLFSGMLLATTNSLSTVGPLLVRANFAKSLLVFSSCGLPLVEFFIRIAPVIGVIFFEKYVPSWTSIFLPVLILQTIIMAVTIGFILSLINVLYKDLDKIVSIFLSFGIFLSPIIYPLPENKFLFFVNNLNPFTPVLVTTQNLISGSNLEFPIYLPIVSIATIFLFFFSWKIFNISVQRVSERA